MDKSNIGSVEELLDILVENNLKDCCINLGHVKDYTKACASVVDTCLSSLEYAKENLEFMNILYKKRFTSNTYPYYPGIKANYCCADSSSAFVVDPKGYLYKCWNDVGNTSRSVGNVKNPENLTDENNMVNSKYLLWSPFKFSKCKECEVLPLCMGGCSYTGLRNDNPECENWKYVLDEVLKSIYVQRSMKMSPVKNNVRNYMFILVFKLVI